MSSCFCPLSWTPEGPPAPSGGMHASGWPFTAAHNVAPGNQSRLLSGGLATFPEDPAPGASRVMQDFQMAVIPGRVRGSWHGAQAPWSSSRLEGGRGNSHSTHPCFDVTNSCHRGRLLGVKGSSGPSVSYGLDHVPCQHSDVSGPNPSTSEHG